ncbi:hypothetical protein BDV59DRAFT_171797 [Aspergillus ambiguus]|uniref:uncharacterized protein n=1 Tax=Aspergillus ambiguus TaxID=176160 RepID=UPI003CCD0DAB
MARMCRPGPEPPNLASHPGLLCFNLCWYAPTTRAVNMTRWPMASLRSTSDCLRSSAFEKRSGGVSKRWCLGANPVILGLPRSAENPYAMRQ